MSADLPFAIANDKDKIPDSGIPGCKDKMLHHGSVRQRKHHLRTFRRKRSHALSLTSGENDTFHIYSSSCNI
jgi:hypothetical protein